MKSLKLLSTLLVGTFILTACTASGTSENPEETPEQPETTEQTETQPETTSTFTIDGEGNAYGTAVISGYPETIEIPEAFCEGEDCPMFDYVFFTIASSDRVELMDFITEKKGNAFVRQKRIGLGCLQDGQINYSNHSDELGMKEYSLSKELTASILAATATKPLTLNVERLKLSTGMGAPTCYSHLTSVELGTQS